MVFAFELKQIIKATEFLFCYKELADDLNSSELFIGFLKYIFSQNFS